METKKSAPPRPNKKKKLLYQEKIKVRKNQLKNMGGNLIQRDTINWKNSLAKKQDRLNINQQIRKVYKLLAKIINMIIVNFDEDLWCWIVSFLWDFETGAWQRV